MYHEKELHFFYCCFKWTITPIHWVCLVRFWLTHKMKYLIEIEPVALHIKYDFILHIKLNREVTIFNTHISVSDSIHFNSFWIERFDLWNEYKPLQHLYIITLSIQWNLIPVRCKRLCYGWILIFAKRIQVEISVYYIFTLSNED